MLDLVFFEHRAEEIARAKRAGISRFIVDWEWRGKEHRQDGAGTEIDPGTPDDLAAAVANAGANVMCRLNAFGPWTADEIETAVEAGAGCVLLPMVRAPAEAEALLTAIAGRCGAGILVETVAAVESAATLAALPLDAVYLGLNDLAIDRRTPSIFDAVADGTVERVRGAFENRRFGFGGVTVVDGGRPVPCPMLLQEMERLRCDFSFCRRSFKRDMPGRDMSEEIARIRAYWETLTARTPARRAHDRDDLVAFIRAGKAREPAAP